MFNKRKILSVILLLCLFAGSLGSCGTPVPGKTDPAGQPTDPSESISDPMGEPETSDTPESTDPAASREPETQPAERKSIDVYLIAGQSNAVGYTRITDRESAYAFAPELETGFSNVLFSGETRWDYSGPRYVKSYNWQKTTLGLGSGNDGGNMGPEAGMAKALSAYYNEESGNTAGIIKFGHGGTSLRNVTTGSNRFGNWVSPSYAEELGIPYQGKGSATGALYRDFLTVIEKQLRKLKDLGYTDFRIMGLYWMQGEEDRYEPEEYSIAFQYFAMDLRDDLAACVKKITGDDDCGASGMPIYIGTISKTFDWAGASGIRYNQTFIDMQKALAELPTTGECVVVDNSEYAINRMENGESVAVGSDRYHWNQADHLEIGLNVGNAMLKYYHYVE